MDDGGLSGQTLLWRAAFRACVVAGGRQMRNVRSRVAFRLASSCGSKNEGTPANLSQIIITLGQQSIQGKRVLPKFFNDINYSITLPHHNETHIKKHSFEPQDSGYIKIHGFESWGPCNM